jgi:hypothetical protein
MPFNCILKIANPSPYERSDFVEVDDLKALGVPPNLDDSNLRLMRRWQGGFREEIALQVDYPFGRQTGYRTLTFFSRNTPPGDPDYKDHTAEFLLEEGTPSTFTGAVSQDALKVQHYSAPGVCDRDWDSAKNIIGVELSSGVAPPEQNRGDLNGLQLYFNLVPRPEPASPFNYSGAATSILHHRGWGMTLTADALAPHYPYRPHSPQKCWGQLTALDFYPLPWERRYYQTESLLGQGGKEPRYTLAWSKTGPLRATVTLKSEVIHVRYEGKPFVQPDKLDLSCHVYRIISVYPNKEFYTEQLIVRPEVDGLDPSERISLSFRAHYYSYLDYPERVPVEVARFENIPDYFAVWRCFGPHHPHRGYAFASDSHIRKLEVSSSELRWRLQLGHEHRCVHLFPFHAWPETDFSPYHEVGHTGWYEHLLKPLQVLPLNRYVSPE